MPGRIRLRDWLLAALVFYSAISVWRRVFEQQSPFRAIVIHLDEPMSRFRRKQSTQRRRDRAMSILHHKVRCVCRSILNTITPTFQFSKCEYGVVKMWLAETLHITREALGTHWPVCPRCFILYLSLQCICSWNLFWKVDWILYNKSITTSYLFYLDTINASAFIAKLYLHIKTNTTVCSNMHAAAAGTVWRVTLKAIFFVAQQSHELAASTCSQIRERVRTVTKLI